MVVAGRAGISRAVPDLNPPSGDHAEEHFGIDRVRGVDIEAACSRQSRSRRRAGAADTRTETGFGIEYRPCFRRNGSA